MSSVRICHNTWRYLIGSLVLASLLISIGVTLVSAYANRRQQTRLELDTNLKTMQKLRERYRQAIIDEPTIRKTAEQFDDLRRQGLIEPEDRLDWTSHLKRLKETHRIPKLEFELAPQHNLFQIDTENEFVLAASTMTLRADLLHEGDLLRILADFESTKNARVVTKHCDIERATSPTEGEIFSTLQASCTFDWITIQQKKSALTTTTNTR